MSKCSTCGGNETDGEMVSGFGGVSGKPGLVIHEHRSLSTCAAVEARYAQQLEMRVASLEDHVKHLYQDLQKAFNAITELGLRR